MAHSRPNQENPPKHKSIMTNISYTYSYNSLTNFDNKAHAKKLKLPCEKIVRLLQVNLILAGFSYLEPQWAVEWLPCASWVYFRVQRLPEVDDKVRSF